MLSCTELTVLRAMRTPTPSSARHLVELSPALEGGSRGWLASRAVVLPGRRGRAPLSLSSGRLGGDLKEGAEKEEKGGEKEEGGVEHSEEPGAGTSGGGRLLTTTPAAPSIKVLFSSPTPPVSLSSKVAASAEDLAFDAQIAAQVLERIRLEHEAAAAAAAAGRLGDESGGTRGPFDKSHWAPEFGGPSGLEPTRFGDWEKKGRVSDF